MLNVGDLVKARWRNGRGKPFEMTGRITQIDRRSGSYVVQGFDADGFPLEIGLSATNLQKVKSTP
jgi:hypothetical protein